MKWWTRPTGLFSLRRSGSRETSTFGLTALTRLATARKVKDWVREAYFGGISRFSRPYWQLHRWFLTDNTLKALQELNHLYNSCYYICPRVEAGRNTSAVIPASRKRRREGNPVVSEETVMYGYESSATLATDRLQYKLQTRPLVREGAPRRGAKQFSGKIKGKVR
jgi:hypothetical protein